MRIGRISRMARVGLAVVMTVTSLVAVEVLGGPTVEAAPTVPPGFSDSLVASGFDLPTAMEFLPDGRMLVAEKKGVIKVVQTNGSTSTVIDLQSRVSDHWDRGLIGMAVDPDFATTGHVYLLYPYQDAVADETVEKTIRLTRITMSGNTANPASESVILGSLTSPGCSATPQNPQCIPNDWYGHSAGSIVFAPDETMYVAIGDGASWDEVDPRALRSQNLDEYPGKILHIDRTGAGVASNPYYQAPGTSIRSKVFASGFRNPFRMTLQPGTSKLIVGDVGWLTREELNIVSAGDNRGWPCYEGTNIQPGYDAANFSVCENLYAAGSGAVDMPDINWSTVGGGSAVGGPWAALTNFPAPWNQGFFYGDYAQTWIRYAQVDGSGNFTGTTAEFASGLDTPVELQVGPDQSLYYVAIMGGQIRKISTGSTPPPPPPSGNTYLSDLSPTGLPINGWGPFEEDQSNGDDLADDGQAITIGGVTYSKGLGVHASSDLSYVLDAGLPCRLQAVVGIDDEVGASGSVVFQVWNGTSTKLYDSGVRTGADPGVAIDVSLVGLSAVRLVVTDGGDTEAFDHADWADAKFVCSTTGSPVATIATPSADARFHVGDTVNFSGSATDPQDGTLAPSALSWTITIHHCPQGNCHDHYLGTATGSSGSFVLPDHGDDTYLTVDLTATDSGGLTSRVSRRVEYETSTVTMLSSPPGQTLLYDGNAVVTPYVTNVPVGSRRTLGAPTTFNGVEFSGWNNGGSISHDVVISSGAKTFVANYGDSLTPVTPARLMDTREGLGGVVLAPGEVRELQVSGRGGVPSSGVTAVSLNVTVTEPTSSGFVTVWPSGAGQPLASNLNFVAGQTVPNAVVVGVGTDGKISLFNSSGSSHVVVDVTGWFSSGFTPVTPARLMDTREGLGGVVLAPGEARALQVAGRGGVPSSGATAVSLNVTVTEPTSSGYVTVWPSGAAQPLASNLNFVAGQTVPNAVVVGVGADGTVMLFNSSGSSHLVVDVTGWFSSGFTPVTPARLMDTREGLGGVVLAPGEARDLQVSGRGGVPSSGVGAVSLNVTVTGPTSSGFVTVWPSGAAQPLASNLNFVAGQTVPNAVIVGVSADGKITLFNSSGSSHLVVDVTGWFDAAPAVPDTTGPVVSARTVSALTATTANVNWTTDEAATSQVEWGTTTSYGSTSTLDPSLVTSHTVGLTGLSASTLYHYRIRTTDAAGNETVTADATFTTAAVGGSLVYLSSLTPSVAPVNGWGPIENDSSNGGDLAADGVTQSINGVEFAKGVGVNAVSDVRYTVPGGCTTFLAEVGVDDEVGGLGTVVFQVWNATSTQLYTSGALTGSSAARQVSVPLAGVTTLRLVVTNGGDDESFDHANWADARLVCSTGTADITAPGISAVASGSVTSSGATITWTTNEAATSQVEYGFTTEYGSVSALNATAVSSHSRVITGLTPNKTYHYRVRSRDAGGNVSVSADATFSTTGSMSPAFANPTSYPTGEKSHGLVAANLNAGGVVDVAVVNTVSNTVTVMLGTGSGTFGAPASYATGLEPKAVTAGDLDGDGDLDLVTSNQGSDNISVLLNNGAGVFGAKTDYAACGGAHESTLALLNGDSDLDVAVACWDGTVISVLLGGAGGSFGAKTDFASGSTPLPLGGPHSIVALFADGDAFLDLAVADYLDARVGILMGNGNGTFDAPVTYPVGVYPHSVRAGDLNGDGDDDLVTANDTTNDVTVLISNGDGTFEPEVAYTTVNTAKSVALADVNSDGDLDVVTANINGNYPDRINPDGADISIFYGNGDGTLQAPVTLFSAGTPFAVTTADLNADGKRDILAANWWGGTLTVHLQS